MRSDPLAVAIVTALIGIVRAAELTIDDVVSYGLSLGEFNAVRDSESPFDFGGLGTLEADELWSDAAHFEYEVATSHASDHALSSPGYHPYLVCSSFPDLSGYERQARVVEYFANTPNVSVSQYYTGGNIFLNSDALSCGPLRAFNDTIARVYEANPDAAEYMRVNPLHPSMKMTAGTMAALGHYIAQTDGGDAVTTSGSDGRLGRMADRTLELHMVLCPGVQEFDGGDVSDEQIASDVKGFLTERGTVESLSFYYQHLNSEMHGGEPSYTNRMSQWSEAISKVTNMTQGDGSNHCLDSFIQENYEFAVYAHMLDVRGKMSHYEFKELGQLLGLADEDVEACYLYMAYGLALNPLVCTLEPSSQVTTLCEDGTSDLSRCPVGGASPGTAAGVSWKVRGLALLFGVFVAGRR